MNSILIAGGDMRQVMLARLLQKKGYDVYITGFDKLGIENNIIAKPDYVFLPIPYKNADGSIKTQFSDNKLFLSDIVSKYPESAYILGDCDDTAKSIFKDIRYTDLLQNETFLIRNAMLTAQGAVCAYLKSTDSALCDKTCLVIGYGRIAKFLCRILRSCNTDIIATARKDKDLELIWSEGYEAVRTKDVKRVLPEADIIYNTVPYHILGEEEIACIKQGAKYIELASSPYGTDLERAKKMGVDVQLEPGIPGRYFPASAAKAALHAFEGEEK